MVSFKTSLVGQRTIIYPVNDMDSSLRTFQKLISIVNIAPLLMFTSHHLIPVINRISVGLNSFVGDQISGHPEEIDNTVTLHQPTDTIFNLNEQPIRCLYNAGRITNLDCTIASFTMKRCSQHKQRYCGNPVQVLCICNFYPITKQFSE